MSGVELGDPTSQAFRSRSSSWVDAAWIIGGSLLLGGLTSVAQGVLPDSIRPFANSPSGWALLTVVMIAIRRPPLLPALFLGAFSFMGLVMGYTIVSELRGLTYHPLLWAAVALIAGPAIGWSTSATFDARLPFAVTGSSLIAGVAITDAIYGLTAVADTTSPAYWVIAGTAGVVFLGCAGLRRPVRWWVVALRVGLTIGWVSLGSAGYAALNTA